MSYPELLLSNQICFLFHRIDRAIVANYKPLLEEFGLTYPQYLAMLALWENREMTVGELCRALVLDTGTVSPLLKRLESLGYIERRRGDSSDERVVKVSLTNAGETLEEGAKNIPGTLASCIFESVDEYKTLKPLLDAMAARLEEPRRGQAIPCRALPK
jgi:DNA-binding MarR family transcriptional regulator